MARDPIALIFTQILDLLEGLVPLVEATKAQLAYDPEPREPAEAGIGIGPLFPDEDGFWDRERAPELCDLLVGEDTDSAHTVLQRNGAVQPLREAFEDLLGLLDSQCPAFHRSFLRLNVTAWRYGPGKDIQFGAYFYGKALSGMDKGTNLERGKRLSKLVRTLAPLDKPTAWWMIESDGCPVAAAGAVEACAVYQALGSQSFQLKTWLRGQTQDPGAHAWRLTAPDDLRAAAANLLAKA
jgi:hypothetical protein